MAHAHKGGISHSPEQQFATPKQRYALPGATIRPRTDESNHAESTRASSNSAAENAAMGPHCSVFFPGWRKTRPWGLSKHLEVAEKARKGVAKREKRQKSPHGAPNAILGPCSEAPYRRFLPSCEQNRATGVCKIVCVSPLKGQRLRRRSSPAQGAGHATMAAAWPAADWRRP